MQKDFKTSSRIGLDSLMPKTPAPERHCWYCLKPMPPLAKGEEPKLAHQECNPKIDLDKITIDDMIQIEDDDSLPVPEAITNE